VRLLNATMRLHLEDKAGTIDLGKGGGGGSLF